MFTVNFYTSCFVIRGNSIGKKTIRLDWEKAVYGPPFMLTNTVGTYFHVRHGTKTIPVFLPAVGEASWLLLPSSVSLLSGDAV